MNKKTIKSNYLLKDEEIKQLIRNAIIARKNSYSPYSKYMVGAALLCKNEGIYLGCNIENASYGPTICAERVAIFKAVSDGVKEFKAIAIVGSPSGDLVSQYAFPCGVCRQVMAEFCDVNNFIIIVAKSVDDYEIHTLEELLPKSFGPQNIEEI